MAAFFYVIFTVCGSYVVAADNSIATELIREANSANIYQEASWNALIHFDDSKANIVDRSFLLSYPDVSPKRELEQTIQYLYSGEDDAVCRFPARYYWLKSRITTAPDLPLGSCHDVIEFNARAPVSDIYLAFASENITSPASMLGHTFLRITGYDEQGSEISHTVSFYIDANTWNLPQLFFESMVIGKKGFFALTPYADKIKEYVLDEQRRVWEYKLDLNDQQKQLIELHLLELKNTDMTYLFQSYNCATVINFILKLSGRKFDSKQIFIMPKHVIKNAHMAGIINDVRVITPSRLIIRDLQQHISGIDRKIIKANVESGDLDFLLDSTTSDADYIRLELTSAYNQYYNLNNNDDLFADNVDKIRRLRVQKFPDKNIDIDQKYDPVYSPGNSQFSFSTIIDNGNPSVAITFLPASHTLLDDNLIYGTESELQLFSPTLKIPISNKAPYIHRFALYSIQNLLPRDMFTGGVSTKLFIGYDEHRNSDLRPLHAFSINGALGVTERFSNDLDLYMLFGGGVNYAKIGPYVYLTSELGIVAREIWDMKSIMSISSTTSVTNKQFGYGTLKISQAKYINKYLTATLEYSRYFNNYKPVDQFTLGLKTIF